MSTRYYFCSARIRGQLITAAFSVVPDAMVRRTPTVPALFDPLTFQPLMSIATDELLNNSTNSSLPPFGPRKRNSLIKVPAEVCARRTGMESDATRLAKTHKAAASERTRVMVPLGIIEVT